MYGAENFGCFEHQNGTNEKRDVYCAGTKDRKEKEGDNTTEITGRLFEEIGEYLRISLEAERQETEDEASGVEGFEKSVDGSQIDGASRATLTTENIRTYTASGGVFNITDTAGFEPLRHGCNFTLHHGG